MPFGRQHDGQIAAVVERNLHPLPSVVLIMSVSHLAEGPVHHRHLSISGFAVEGAVAGGLLFERILPAAIRIDGVDDGQDFTVTQRDLRLERTIRMLGNPIRHLGGGLIVER